MGGVSAKTVYVATNGSSGNNGTSFASRYDFKTALGKVTAGDTILVQGGTHTIPYVRLKENTFEITINGSQGKLIYIVAEKSKRALFDFSHPDNCRLLDDVPKGDSKLRSYGFEVTGSYLYFYGIDITRAGYQGAYVTGKNITFENCKFYKNWNTGLEINKGGSNVTVLNCDAYGNYDGKYKDGGMADGFGPKEDQGPGNKFVNCRSWGNSDDAYDCYSSPETVIFENCWAIRNGFDAGNGNGFKVGGYSDKNGESPKVAHIKLTNCISFGHKNKGFDQNNNAGGITVLNCTSYKNGINYGFGNEDVMKSGEKHTLKNNISLDGTNVIKVAKEANNSWNGLDASTSDFESLDTSLATKERNIDGSLPVTNLFRLKSTSALVNKGVDVGISFKGTAPDLGAFECEASTDVTTPFMNVAGLLSASQLLQNNQLVISLNSVASDARVNVYTLQGNKILGATTRNGRELSVDCSSISSGRYITELDVDGVKQQMTFTK